MYVLQFCNGTRDISETPSFRYDAEEASHLTQQGSMEYSVGSIAHVQCWPHIEARKIDTAPDIERKQVGEHARLWEARSIEVGPIVRNTFRACNM